MSQFTDEQMCVYMLFQPNVLALEVVDWSHDAFRLLYTEYVYVCVSKVQCNVCSVASVEEKSPFSSC